MRKTFGPLKAKQCKLGAQCGGSCIAKSKNCTVGLNPKDKGKVLLSLHKVGIAHNDSHPENIFYDKATNKVTIIDFGLATRNTPSDLFQEYKRSLEAYISINYNQQFTTVDSYVKWLKD